jgi:acetyl-CoA C-acetyltransferase
VTVRDVAVIGIGETRFGELWDKSFRELGIEAGLQAIEDAGIAAEDLDAIYVGNMSAGKFVDQEHVSALVADYAGLADLHLPTIRVEGGGACGAVALYQARAAIASGMFDIAIVGGAEKMTDVGDVQANAILSSTADQEWEGVFGATQAALFAMMARRHMYEYGTTREQMAAVAVKNHRNAVLNPNAQYRREIKPEMVLKAPWVAEPLGLFDCAPLSDGAAAVVLCAWEKAHTFTDTPIRILGSGQASDFLALHDRRNLTTLDATVVAGKRAFHQAGLAPDAVQVAEVHDNFTIGEILAIEDLRFVKKGLGGEATEDGETALNARISVNPSGGLKARGYPIGATGVAQAVEVVRQLRNEAGKRQVTHAEVGLTHTIGGSGATAVVHLLGRGV